MCWNVISKTGDSDFWVSIIISRVHEVVWMVIIEMFICFHTRKLCDSRRRIQLIKLRQFILWCGHAYDLES